MSSISSPAEKKNPGATAERILFLLKTRGPLKTADLAPLLKVSLEATRQQLQKLLDAELIAGQMMPAQGAGRPSQKWVLTEQAQARFPDTHAHLTLQLIDSIRAVYGPTAWNASSLIWSGSTPRSTSTSAPRYQPWKNGSGPWRRSVKSPATWPVSRPTARAGC